MVTNVTKHYRNQRYKREKFINKYLNSDGKVIDSFLVNKGHVNGMEKHEVTENGIIIIYNATSNKLVTKLIAREQQLKRLYNKVGREPPKWLIELARYHESLNYNHV